jgi:hypothetical protein
MRLKLFKFCSIEMQINSELYIDPTCNQINFTKLAESFLSENNIEIGSNEESEIFELVIDWFNQWKFKSKYNN